MHKRNNKGKYNVLLFNELIYDQINTLYNNFLIIVSIFYSKNCDTGACQTQNKEEEISFVILWRHLANVAKKLFKQVSILTNAKLGPALDQKKQKVCTTHPKLSGIFCWLKPLSKFHEIKIVCTRPNVLRALKILKYEIYRRFLVC